ncbi:MAG: hypothetical protein PVH21_08500 [Myxococcales bacterium]|jgi:hypothetical protein
MLLSCGDSAETPESLAIAVKSQDRIVSEDGELQLTAGTISLRSISLVTVDGPVLVLGPNVLDLSMPQQQISIDAPVPTGEFSGLRIELGPPAEGGKMLDVELRSLGGTESIRATSQLTMTGETLFPEGPRTITDGARVALQVNLTGMFFYLSPISDAVDGIYEAGENQRDFLTMDLVGMFDLRVLP